MSWPLVQLGSVLRLNYGKGLKAEERIEGQVDVMGSNGKVGSHQVGFTVGDTLIVGRKGSIGKVAFSQNCWPIDTTYYVDEDSTAEDMRWLFWRLQSLGLDQMNKSAAVPGLNRDDVYALEVALPPLPEQRRIASILDRAEAERRSRHSVLRSFDLLHDSVFQRFVALGKAFGRDVSFGEVILESQNGLYKPASSYGSGGSPIVRIADYSGGDRIDGTGLQAVALTAEEVSRFSLENGDLLVNRVNSISHIGKSALVHELHTSAVFESNMMRVRLDRTIAEPAYVLAWLSSADAVRQMRGAAKQAINQASINQKDVAALEMSLPELDVQREYVAFRTQFDALVQKNRQHLTVLEELFASLQHRAFNGEL